jgi:hypothetical protein
LRPLNSRAKGLDIPDYKDIILTLVGFYPMHIRTRYKILFGVTIVLAALYLVTDFKSVPDADATGGAFTSTKHGGADVDSEPNDGVDRSVHPDVGAFYYDDSEAGEYKPGECNHCHEPHASFGGIEPPPFTTEPHAYLPTSCFGTMTTTSAGTATRI